MYPTNPTNPTNQIKLWNIKMDIKMELIIIIKLISMIPLYMSSTILAILLSNKLAKDTRD